MTDLPSWAAGYLDKSVFRTMSPNAAEPAAPPAASQTQPAPARIDPPPTRPSRSRGLVIEDPYARIEGRFESADTIEIGCDLTGEISAGRLVVNETGNVRAQVRTVDALIKGRFSGEIVATGSIEVTATGELGGDVQTNSLVIARGAVFTGAVTRLDQVPSRGDVEIEAAAPAPQNELQPLEERRAGAPLVAIDLEAESANNEQQSQEPAENPLPAPGA